MINELDEIAIKNNTDKSSIHHNYTKNYYDYFKNLKNEKLNLLEIGVNKGSSLRMWKEFFPNSNIFGIDIGNRSKQYEEDRISIFIGKQENKIFLESVVSQIKKIDIIIDDGSHMCNHQIESFNCLFKYLSSDGIYVIEDCNTSYWSDFGGGLNKPSTCVEYFKNRVDDVNMNGYQHSKKRHIANRDMLLMDKSSPNEFEKTIKSIHFYCGMIFILKA